MQVKADLPPEDPVEAALRKQQEQAAEASRLQYTQANLDADTLVRLRRFGQAVTPGGTRVGGIGGGNFGGGGGQGNGGLPTLPGGGSFKGFGGPINIGLASGIM